MGKVFRLEQAAGGQTREPPSSPADAQLMEDCLMHFVTLVRAGKLRGLEICADLEDGSKDMAVVGSYRQWPRLGSEAAMELAVELRLLQVKRRRDDDPDTAFG